MKKKTYKQMQNRLYREIKRRIVAENKIMYIHRIDACQRKVDTLAIRNRIDIDQARYIGYAQLEEMTKREMASKAMTKLLEDGYFLFTAKEDPEDFMSGYQTVECRIQVIRPWGEKPWRLGE